MEAFHCLGSRRCRWRSRALDLVERCRPSQSKASDSFKDERWSTQILNWSPQGRRKGRSYLQKRWEDDINHVLLKLVLTKETGAACIIPIIPASDFLFFKSNLLLGLQYVSHGMPWHMPWHAMAYAMAHAMACHGICHGMLLQDAMACVMACVMASRLGMADR